MNQVPMVAIHFIGHGAAMADESSYAPMSSNRICPCGGVTAESPCVLAAVASIATFIGHGAAMADEMTSPPRDCCHCCFETLHSNLVTKVWTISPFPSSLAAGIHSVAHRDSGKKLTGEVENHKRGSSSITRSTKPPSPLNIVPK